MKLIFSAYPERYYWYEHYKQKSSEAAHFVKAIDYLEWWQDIFAREELDTSLVEETLGNIRDMKPEYLEIIQELT